jgi:hypothetical protein
MIKLNLLVTAVPVLAASAMTVDGTVLVAVMRVVVGGGFTIGHVGQRLCRATVLSGIEV